jgi:hypothetical protein
MVYTAFEFIRARHARVFVFRYVSMHVCMLSAVCVRSGIVSYARVLYRSSQTHMRAYSLERSYIGNEGAQHIVATLAHNSTLQTLK